MTRAISWPSSVPAPASSPPLTDAPSDGPKVARWIERNCRYGEGDKFGQPVRLEMFQKLFLVWLFELKADGSRRYRRAMLEVPKGNGKTPLSAWVATYLLATQPSAVIPVAAASYEQADLLFGDLRSCVKESPTLSPLFDAFEGEIQVKDGPGRAYKVAAVAGTNDGQRPSAFFPDEIHEWTGNKARVHLVIANGLSKRSDSLLLNTTTPGADLDSLAGRLHEYGYKVNSGEVTDDEFLFVHWGVNPDAQDLTTSEGAAAAVRLANPASDAFLNVADVVSRKAQVPLHEWVRYHLGWWTTVAEYWLPPGSAADCVSLEKIAQGADVVLGFDGSFNNDSTALVAVSVADKPHVQVVAAWERPENAQEWQVPILDVEAAIRDACRTWQALEIACDPFRWARSYQVLEGEGLPVVEFPQSPARMTPATQRFYEAIVNQTLTLDGDPRLLRHLGNTTLKVDARGSRLAKEHRNSRRKIDLAIAAVMALDRASWHSANPTVAAAPPGFFAL
jgi:phage terminase large subunit-like protein